MKKLALSLGILVLVGVMAVPVFAWGPRGAWMGRGPGYCWNDEGSASLTPEQRSALNSLQEKFYNETSALRNELWTKRGELWRLLDDPNSEPEKVKAVQKEVSQLRAKLQEQRVEYQLQARKIAPNVEIGPGYGRGYGYGRGHHMMGGYGYGPGHMRGYGYGPGHMRGYGYGPGACWN